MTSNNGSRIPDITELLSRIAELESVGPFYRLVSFSSIRHHTGLEQNLAFTLAELSTHQDYMEVKQLHRLKIVY